MRQSCLKIRNGGKLEFPGSTQKGIREDHQVALAVWTGAWSNQDVASATHMELLGQTGSNLERCSDLVGAIRDSVKSNPQMAWRLKSSEC